MDTAFDADVVVVGLGPVGAIVAALLAQDGLSVTVVERSLELHPMPRAAHVDDEIMRILQRIGIADAIGSSVSPAPAYEFRSACGETLLRLDPDLAGSCSGWPLVDVRDVAGLHLKAMARHEAAGQRYIAANGFAWMKEVAEVLRDRVPALAKRVPQRILPNALVRISGLFDPVLRARLYELGKRRPVSSAKARRDLGWTPRSNAEAIVATAESLTG